jgi:hypothetical protein
MSLRRSSGRRQKLNFENPKLYRDDSLCCTLEWKLHGMGSFVF